tara:strand:+ start:540 stop:824 length:285 start_codon:yes stop_codon:yes gene_type:complete
MIGVKTISEDWKENWKRILTELLNARIVGFISDHFKDQEIECPELIQIMYIKESDIMESWLSVTSMKELLLFQAQLRNNWKSINESLNIKKDEK